MKRTILIIVAIVLIFIGGFVSVIALNAMGWNFLNLDTSVYETKTYEFEDNIENLDLNLLTADINVHLNSENKLKVVCYQDVERKYDVNVTDKTLKIESDKKTVDFKLFSFKSPKIDVYLANSNINLAKIDSTSGDINLSSDISINNLEINTTTANINCNSKINDIINISLTTGDAYIKNVNAASGQFSITSGDLYLENANFSGNTQIDISTGDVRLKNVKLNDLNINGSTSDIDLIDVIASGKIFIDIGTGYVEFSKIDGFEISINTTTGDVEGTILTDKRFVVTSTTGDVSYPRNTDGGLCEINTTTGDIEVRIA